ncbi:hypothetical protein PJP10_32505, partial [Mycobacterium kansasii]
TLGTGPFIVAAGGISNIFLHRLAENIQDAYAEAASIAEQVTFSYLYDIIWSISNLKEADGLKIHCFPFKNLFGLVLVVLHPL